MFLAFLLSLVFTMPLIYLEHLPVFGCFDTSHTSSSVSRGVAHLLGRLQNINILCYPVEDSVSLSCVLNLRIDDNLREGCILGVDYFVQICSQLCELFGFYRVRDF